MGLPGGLDRREVAAYELSRALGWDLVPITVLRDDGPLGSGSLQRFVPADFEQHYFTLYEDPARHDELRAICCFDLVGNNTDRKSGHCLGGLDGRVYAIDNALMFHRDFKLRTVIWEFGGEPIPPSLTADVRRLGEEPLPRPLADCSTPSSATHCSSGPVRWPTPACSPSTRPAAATRGLWSDRRRFSLTSCVH